MSDPYKNAVKKIPVPPELIEKTALSMKQMQQHRPRKRHIVAFGIPAVCAAFAIILFIAFNRLEPDIFITVLQEGRHAEQVELVDGFLMFHKDAESVPPPILSGPGVQKEEWTPERYKEYLGTVLTLDHLPLDLSLTNESAVVCTGNNTILWDRYTMRYESEKGGSLEITVSKGKLPPERGMAADGNSRIGGNPLAVGADLERAVYWAQFIHGGAGYFIEGNNLSQEAFIRILYNFFI